MALVAETLPRGMPGPYQLQAAIPALHDEAPSAGETDWPQITALYEVLMGITDNPGGRDAGPATPSSTPPGARPR
ncbi:putative RNA polymerase sigma factor [Nonomuraea muscovyensis]|uniref:Putative RNA polymerase sigma factor n=1 Tax=Nonomuraea muscovyensis TaxID=1124761 RepID=A0A7X0C5Y3_9ACTN|nr:hypothetical protein [Nonomuraea muscovyensis]MBB6347354.1 putative RNA polymerase sigma factor [Nonomuraea muscovyensis]